MLIMKIFKFLSITLKILFFTNIAEYIKQNIPLSHDFQNNNNVKCCFCQAEFSDVILKTNTQMTTESFVT